MFKTHTDGFAQTKSFEVYNCGIQQFSDLRIVLDTPSCYYALDRCCYELGDYVLVSGVVLDGELLDYVLCDAIGSLDYCLETALRRSRLYEHYQYEIWQLCDDGDLWQGWELSCLSVDHDETMVVPYAVVA